MKAWMVAILALMIGLGFGGAYYRTARSVTLESGVMPSPYIGLPQTKPGAVVFMISGAAGWGAPETALAERLQTRGAVLIGIDLPAWLAALESEKRDCAYTVSAIESISRQVQRQLGVSGYQAPVIAGIGAGGGMALAISAQTPAATIGSVFAADPSRFIALEKPLCTPAPRQKGAGGTSYGLRPTPLTHAVHVLWSAGAGEADRRHVAELRAGHPELTEAEAKIASEAALFDAVADHMAAQSQDPQDLPLAVTPVKPSTDTMAIIVSGDGGWRDIDKKLAGFFAADGLPSVGLDSLRYFWSERTPDELARDLERIIDRYGREFGARNVVLVGYSFGANVLPSSFRRMKPAYQQRVTLISLLAPSLKADFQIAVTGWLGFSGEGKGGVIADEIRLIDPRRIQCIYGLAEKQSACHTLEGSEVETFGIAGGHHFDGNYKSLSDRIVKALLRRLAA